MYYDYKAMIQKLRQNMNIFNVIGRNKAIIILKCLEVCPFIDVVADYLEMTDVALYNKLRYHIGKEQLQLVYSDLAERKSSITLTYKQKYKEDLQRLNLGPI